MCFRIRIFRNWISVSHFLSIQEVEGTIHCNPVKPGGKARTLLKSFQALVGAEKNFLNDLLRVLRVTGHAMNYGINAARMAIHKDAKGILVASQYLRYYGCIRNFHSYNLDLIAGQRLGRN